MFLPSENLILPTSVSFCMDYGMLKYSETEKS